MFFVSFDKPTREQEAAVCLKGQRWVAARRRCAAHCCKHAPGRCAASPPPLAPPHRRGFNYKCAGASQNAPPLPAAAREDGWWAVDRERVKVRRRGRLLPATPLPTVCSALLPCIQYQLI